MDGSRYAIYFTPPVTSLLWQFGSAVLGYDAGSGLDVPFLRPADYDEQDWRELTEEPRRYGFHATLKAPFHLADGLGEDELLAAVARLAERLPATQCEGLDATLIGSFVALTIVGGSRPIVDLAANVVCDLEPLRAPLSKSDRARRLKSPLTARHVELLDAYGYPYVLEEFRFHMTLTGRVLETEREPIRRWLAQSYLREAAEAPFVVDALSVLRQGGRGERFRIIARFPLGGTAPGTAAR